MTAKAHRDEPITIGCISGYSGDRIDALTQILSGPIELDAIVGDFLAEMNLPWRKAEAEAGLSAGEDPTFVNCLRHASAQLGARLDAGKFPRIVVNAGALNPAQLAKDVKAFLKAEYGEKGAALRVAYVTGDNVLHLVTDPSTASSILHLDGSRTINHWDHEPFIANAYIGQFGLVEALRSGADIVVAGRTTDAGTVQALCTWWYHRNSDDYDYHASPLIAGHIIECGNYVTGGNFAGFKRIKDYYNITYPLAKVYSDGHCIITKQPGQNGIVSVDTVRSQLLYEIQGRYYYNPDVVADLSQMKAIPQAENEVHVSGVTGLPPPSHLKVAVLATAGLQAEMQIYAIGIDCVEKFQTFEVQTRMMLDKIAQATGEPLTMLNEATTTIRIFAQSKTEMPLRSANFMYPIMQNLGQAFPGFTPDLEYPRTTAPRPYMSYFLALIDRRLVLMKVTIDDDSTIDEGHFTPQKPSHPKQENYEPTSPRNLEDFGKTTKIPLGYQVFAQSGDKGANVSIGFFPQGDDLDEWEWLRSFMTTPTLLKLLGKDAAEVQQTERVEFHGIRAVHFALVGMLGEGVTNTKRAAALGKGIAEYLRSKPVEYPEKLYRGYESRI